MRNSGRSQIAWRPIGIRDVVDNHSGYFRIDHQVIADVDSDVAGP